MEIEHIQISDIVALQDLLQSYGQVNGARERGDGWVDEQNRTASLTRRRPTQDQLNHFWYRNDGTTSLKYFSGGGIGRDCYS